MKFIVSILVLITFSCSTYHTERIQRGKDSISKVLVEKIKKNETTKSEIKEMFGEPYFTGKLGENVRFVYIAINGQIRASEHSKRSFKKIQKEDFPELKNWQSFATERNTKVAIGHQEKWYDAKLVLEFKNDIVSDIKYFYTPSKSK